VTRRTRNAPRRPSARSWVRWRRWSNGSAISSGWHQPRQLHRGAAYPVAGRQREQAGGEFVDMTRQRRETERAILGALEALEQWVGDQLRLGLGGFVEDATATWGSGAGAGSTLRAAFRVLGMPLAAATGLGALPVERLPRRRDARMGDRLARAQTLDRQRAQAGRRRQRHTYRASRRRGRAGSPPPATTTGPAHVCRGICARGRCRSPPPAAYLRP
jgi:hypothetical protein